MTVIPITRCSPRKGWYRCSFGDLPDFRLLVPVAWNRHMTFAMLCQWPQNGKWKELTYVPAPRRPEPVGRVML